MSETVYLGIDVGTSSVRVAAVDTNGCYLGDTVEEVSIWKPAPGFYEQSSDEIWNGVCVAVRRLLQRLQLGRDQIGGVGFDATCSLVIVSPTGRLSEGVNATTISSAKYHPDVVMWMDHRAEQEAKQINKSNHHMLNIVGGKISLEMEPPKLMWLKKNKRKLYDNAEYFMDLVDFLTWKATGNTTRSLCTTVCKWLLDADEQKRSWNQEFYDTIGLSDLPTSGKIGSVFLNPGEPVPGGVDANAAVQLGLRVGTPVAVGIIDAHSGVIAAMATKLPPDVEGVGGDRLTMICGTSTCHMALSRDCRLVEGVWGPYFGAVLPDLYLNEAGQSAVGPILDMVIRNYSGREQKLETQTEELNRQLGRLQSELDTLSFHRLATGVHIWPDYHGNRSPMADPCMPGGVVGLRLQEATDENNLLVPMYLAHIFSFAYMTRWIVECLTAAGYCFSAVFMCGGLAKNNVYVQAHADVLGLPVVVPQCDQTVALGAAILAASAATNQFPSIDTAMAALGAKGRVVLPNKTVTTAFHEKRYKIFRQFGHLVDSAKFL